MSENTQAQSNDSVDQDGSAVETPSTIALLTKQNKRDGFFTGTGTDASPSSSDSVKTPIESTSEKVTVPLDRQESKSVEDIIQPEQRREEPAAKPADVPRETPPHQDDLKDYMKDPDYVKKLEDYQRKLKSTEKRVSDTQRSYHGTRQNIIDAAKGGEISEETAQKLLRDPKFSVEQTGNTEQDEIIRMGMEVHNAIDLVGSRDVTAKLEYKAFRNYYDGLDDSDRAEINLQLLSMENVAERVHFVTTLGRENVDEADVELAKYGNDRDGVRQIYQRAKVAEQKAREAEERALSLQKENDSLMDGGRKGSLKTRANPSMAAPDNDVQTPDGTVDTLSFLSRANSPKRFSQK